MPATILSFERRRPTSGEAAPPASPPALRPQVQQITSRQIAHRWAMLSHLRRHVPPKERGGQPSDPVR